MNEARPYASLSSGLLARKGTAKPAMRPQNYGSLEDLGWNDMGQAPGERTPPPPAEHVPSSIAALTPAPKIQRTNPGDAHLPPDADVQDAYEEAEQGFETAEEASEAPAAFETPAGEPTAHEPPAHEPPAEFAEPVDFEAPASYEPPAEYRQPTEFAEESAEAFDAAEPAAETEAEPVFDASVVAQQRAILERFDGFEEHEAEHEPAPSRDARADVVPLPQRAIEGGKRKAAFTLRLDAERHLRLRLACAVTRHSAQQIVARALDEALANIPEIESLASQVPAKPGRAGKG